ncbi:hypothetical protein J4526_08205 [Desulfurococcaceae archaeon MEX13E-LK6-19]|nr:hypothetical protein J4526_08205 [Desulfurococcaceae archaeon MEX13E-LK6-19]
MTQQQYYIPAVLIMTGEKPIEHELDSVLACIYYYLVTKHREGLIVSARKRIKAISILYYPFNIIDVHGKYAAVIDAITKPVYTTVFDKPILEDIVDRLNALGEMRGQAFIEEISNIKNLLEAMYSEKEGTVTRRYEIRGLVYNKNVLDELRVLVNTASQKGLPGLVIPEKSIDTNEVKHLLEEILDETSKVIDQLTSMMNSLDQHYARWRKQIEVEHEVKKKELEKEVESIKLVIQKRIEEYEARLEIEKSRIDEKYSMEEKELLDKIRSLEERIEVLRRKVEEGIAREEDRIELKKLVRERKRLEKRLESIKRIKNKQKRAIETKIQRIIGAETMRQKYLEKELERYGRELDKMVTKASYEVEDLKRTINKLIEQTMELRKRVTSILLELPSLGVGKYLVPFIAILYTTPEGIESLDIIPLVKIYASKTMFSRQTKIIETQTLASRALRLKSIVNTTEYRKMILTVNLLDKKYLDTASRGFEKLVKEDIISSGEAYESLSLIESYIES